MIMHAVLQIILIDVLLVHSQSSYPIFNATCSNHYDCGYSIGQQAKTRIKRYISTYPNMQDLRHCLLTGCSVDLRDLVFYNQDIWPQYYEEMQGIAAGADVDEMDIHLLTFKHEILSLRQTKEKVLQDEGSDILMNEKGILRFEGFGHNEDGWSQMEQIGFFSHYNINKETDFFAFDYPGSLIGHGFGFNKYGLAISTNILFPSNVSTQARSIYFLSRAMYDAQNISHAINIINDYKINENVCSYGISINLGYLDKNDNNKITIVNVELSNNDVSIQYYSENEQPYGYHYDMYLRLNVQQEIDVSSEHRLNRTQEIIQQNGIPKHEQDIVQILGDVSDSEYPIYRSGNSPDSAATLATAIFDLHGQSVSIYEMCNPKICDASLTFSLA
eukprot:249599_1